MYYGYNGHTPLCCPCFMAARNKKFPIQGRCYREGLEDIASCCGVFEHDAPLAGVFNASWHIIAAYTDLGP